MQVRKILGEMKGFDYLDEDALPIWNTITQAKFIHKVFSSLQVFPWRRGGGDARPGGVGS